MKGELFSEKIVGWYQQHHRHLPWRNTPDPYKIWLSEIILQQTRVVQGLPYYRKFILHYPNINSLAAAKEKEVLRLWQGLGYYTRARNLLKCAREIQKKFNGKFPSTFEELKRLPGIGDYTAAAISSIAFHQSVAVVDGNVYRVLSRVFGIDKNTASPEGKKFFFDWANQLVPNDQPGTHNQAVMEFGALNCLPQNPKCDECIFMKTCFAFQHDLQNQLPIKIKKQKITTRHLYYLVLRRSDKFLMKERTHSDIWKGLFDFPVHEDRRSVSSAVIWSKFFSHSMSSQQKKYYSKNYKHILTHQIIHARFLAMDWPAGKSLPRLLSSAVMKWYSLRQIELLPKPVLITRYLADKALL